MRIISKKTKYCLRALYLLARNYGNGPMLVQHIADEEFIPKKFLELILLTAKAGGLVDSKPGRGGGYHLTTAPDKVTVGQVIRLMEGPLAPAALRQRNGLPALRRVHRRKNLWNPDGHAQGAERNGGNSGQHHPRGRVPFR